MVSQTLPEVFTIPGVATYLLFPGGNTGGIARQAQVQPVVQMASSREWRRLSRQFSHFVQGTFARQFEDQAAFNRRCR